MQFLRASVKEINREASRVQEYIAMKQKFF